MELVVLLLVHDKGRSYMTRELVRREPRRERESWCDASEGECLSLCLPLARVRVRVRA